MRCNPISLLRHCCAAVLRECRPQGIGWRSAKYDGFDNGRRCLSSTRTKKGPLASTTSSKGHRRLNHNSISQHHRLHFLLPAFRFKVIKLDRTTTTAHGRTLGGKGCNNVRGKKGRQAQQKTQEQNVSLSWRAGATSKRVSTEIPNQTNLRAVIFISPLCTPFPIFFL